MRTLRLKIKQIKRAFSTGFIFHIVNAYPNFRASLRVVVISGTQWRSRPQDTRCTWPAIFSMSYTLLLLSSREPHISIAPLTLPYVTVATSAICNRNLKTSKALLKIQAHQGTSLFTSAATNQRGFPRGGQEKLRSDFQNTRRRQSSF